MESKPQGSLPTMVAELNPLKQKSDEMASTSPPSHSVQPAMASPPPAHASQPVSSPRLLSAQTLLNTLVVPALSISSPCFSLYSDDHLTSTITNGTPLSTVARNGLVRNQLTLIRAACSSLTPPREPTHAEMKQVAMSLVSQYPVLKDESAINPTHPWVSIRVNFLVMVCFIQSVCVAYSYTCFILETSEHAKNSHRM